MTSVLLDTHAFIWSLSEIGRLSPAAAGALAEVYGGEGKVYVSSITLVEIRYLVEKGRVARRVLEGCLLAVNLPDLPIEVLAVDLAVARALKQIPRDEVPDLPDRIIAATALLYGVPLISRSREIRASGVATIW